jgi:2-iminobutanoate/2-iminopropanoate deaminase
LPSQSVHTDQAPAAIGPYSQGIIANGVLYTAGQIALDPASGQVVAGDIVAQTEQVFRNLSAVLGAAGASWKDVVKTTVYLADMADFPRMNEVYARVMGDARPARSTVQVAGLPRGVAVEIDLIATGSSARGGARHTSPDPSCPPARRARSSSA